MRAEATAGYIFVTFDEFDWRRPAGQGAMAVIDSIKSMIPKEDRSYDPETKVWSILDKPEHRKTLRELKKFYLEDENQEEMFG